jgi:hypothetical protein
VLESLLATYSDEKLKEIQLSIQEKEKIQDITREEVEKALQQNGLEVIASGLKYNIEKGVVLYRYIHLGLAGLHTGFFSGGGKSRG